VSTCVCLCLCLACAGRLREEDVKEWLANIRSAAPPHEAPLVELLCQWARRGKLIMPAADGIGGVAASRRKSLDDPSFYSNQTCGPASFLSSMARAEKDQKEADQQRQQQQEEEEAAVAAAAATAAAAAAAVAAAGTAGGEQQPAAGGQSGGHHPTLKRIRTDASVAAGGCGPGCGHTHHHSHHHHQQHAHVRVPQSPHGVLLPGLSHHFHDSSSLGSTPTTAADGGIRPIDHIFQFHKALRWVGLVGRGSGLGWVWRDVAAAGCGSFGLGLAWRGSSRLWVLQAWTQKWLVC
jgi:hypothetical protein